MGIGQWSWARCCWELANGLGLGAGGNWLMVLGWLLVGIVQLASGLGQGAGGNWPMVLGWVLVGIGQWSWAGCWWELFSWPVVLENQRKEQVVEDCRWKRGPRREAWEFSIPTGYKKTLLFIIDALSQVLPFGSLKFHQNKWTIIRQFNITKVRVSK